MTKHSIDLIQSLDKEMRFEYKQEAIMGFFLRNQGDRLGNPFRGVKINNISIQQEV